MPAGMSLDQMMRTPFIMGIINRIHPPGSAIQRYYGLGPNSPASQTIKGRVGQYDIFDFSRSLAPMSSPLSPPTRINRKQIGSVPITLPRTYTAVDILIEQVYNTRNLGQQFGPVNSNGDRYIALQTQYAKSRHVSNIEFMASRMFAGGWSVKEMGSHLVLAEKGDAAAVAVNDTRVPADHLDQLDGIIDVSWDDATANLVEQFQALQVRAARVNGRRITECWLNGNTAKHLFTNTVLQGVGGSVYRIFDTFNPSREIDPASKIPDTGVSVVWRGLPDITFHIYNQGYVLPGTSEAFLDQIDAAKWTPFIPDGKAILTPPPGEWCGSIHGSEMVQWSLTSPLEEVYGFGMGIERAIDPPRFDIKMLNNAAPVITEPYAVYYPTVIFGGGG
jgi:hypothetical protein